MILVTGAGGKTGRAVSQALAAHGQKVRAMTRSMASMADREAFARAAEGARAIYHICPNVSPDEVLFGKNAIAAARTAGIKRFVYHSVLHPQIEDMPHHWNKMRVEELLFASGLDVTILQPTAYMQNLLANWPAIGSGVHRTPYPAATRISLVDLGDVGEVAAKVLTEDGHAGATYELVGTPPLSQIEVAAILSDALAHPVRVEAETIEAWRSRSGLRGPQAETLIKMFRYYERHGLTGSPNTLRWLLGREPTSLAAFARAAQA
ncbi:MAG TPA: NmrA family NAD(P)-binding protein [Reyranella sp.]|jgi:uncharacterized protein YbjT (DUF2867 family)|nr:NmrA family NAD(P)-binding protein [Reyranella sp.]